MSTGSKVTIIVLLLIFIGAIAATDALVREQSLTSQLTLWLDHGSSSSSVAGGQQQSSVAQTPPVVAQASSVDPQSITSVITANGFTFTQSSDPSILTQVAQGTTINSYVILRDGDRTGSVHYLQSAQAVQILQALKQSLLQSFSGNLQDLRDETVADPGKPVRNVLTFFDPGLSDERLVFVRTGDMLFEIHITRGKEDLMFPLVDALTAQ